MYHHDLKVVREGLCITMTRTDRSMYLSITCEAVIRDPMLSENVAEGAITRARTQSTHTHTLQYR